MTNNIYKSLIQDVLRSLLITLIFSLIFSILEGAIIHYLPIGDVGINIMNIVFLAVSIVLGLCLGIRVKERGMIKGLIVGMLYVLLVYLIFVLTTHSGAISLVKVIDMITCVIFAIIGGIISVNIKSK